MPVDEPKPGPSGFRGNTKKDNGAIKKVFVKPENKKNPLRNRGHRTQLQQHVRRSSYEPLRYKLRARTEGTQQSHSVRRIIAAQQRPIRTREKQTRLIVYQPEPTRRSHHHLDAVDFYFRSSNYGRDELQKDRQKSFARSQRQDPLIKVGPYAIPKRYCKNCLEPLAKCICILSMDTPNTSDWQILLTQRTKRKKTFITPRNEWLENLEENTQINIDDIEEEKFNIGREICCFPFNTFKIFSKQDVKNVDFYKKKIK